MINKFILLFLFFLLTYCAYSQESIDTTLYEYEYDTVYVANDTIKETVEIINYQYKKVKPIHLLIKAGVGYTSENIRLQNHKTQTNAFLIPVNVGLLWNNWLLELGYTHHRNEYITTIADSTQIINSGQITEEIVIDTIYKENKNNGNPIPVIYTKEVTRLYSDTSYNDTIISDKHYLSFSEIPLTIGYQIKRGKLSLQVLGGVSLCLISSKSTPALQTYLPNNETYFFSLLAEGSVSYTIYKNIAVQLGIKGSWKTNNDDFSINTATGYLKISYTIF